MAYPALDHRIRKLLQRGIYVADIAQRRYAEQPGSFLTACSAGGVFAVDQCMGRLGVQDQDLQTSAAGVESNLLGPGRSTVEEQRMASGAQSGGGLVHQAGRGADE